MKFVLKQYNRDVTDKELLDDLINVAKKLNKATLKSKDYDQSKINRFHSSTIARRIGSWNEALRKAGLKINVQYDITDEELLADLKRVAKEVAPKKVTQEIYNSIGKVHSSTINTRFGWNSALQKAGLEISLNLNISEDELFENMEQVWLTLGKQPGKREMIQLLSKYSVQPYLNKYGTWLKALQAFVEFMNSDLEQNEEKELFPAENNIDSVKQNVFKHKTKRDPNLRLKVHVLMRDGNKCRLCGITVTGGNIHFDHIKPWSKGGETVLENLQILCAEHNFGKGNLEYD